MNTDDIRQWINLCETQKVSETAPSGKKAEDFIKQNKKKFKKRYGAEKGEEILYATAWKLFGHKKKHKESVTFKDYFALVETEVRSK